MSDQNTHPSGERQPLLPDPTGGSRPWTPRYSMDDTLTDLIRSTHRPRPSPTSGLHTLKNLIGMGASAGTPKSSHLQVEVPAALLQHEADYRDHLAGSTLHYDSPEQVETMSEGAWRHPGYGSFQELHGLTRPLQDSHPIDATTYLLARQRSAQQEWLSLDSELSSSGQHPSQYHHNPRGRDRHTDGDEDAEHKRSLPRAALATNQACGIIVVLTLCLAGLLLAALAHKQQHDQLLSMQARYAQYPSPDHIHDRGLPTIYPNSTDHLSASGTSSGTWGESAPYQFPTLTPASADEMNSTNVHATTETALGVTEDSPMRGGPFAQPSALFISSLRRIPTLKPRLAYSSAPTIIPSLNKLLYPTIEKGRLVVTSPSYLPPSFAWSHRSRSVLARIWSALRLIPEPFLNAEASTSQSSATKVSEATQDSSHILLISNRDRTGPATHKGTLDRSVNDELILNLEGSHAIPDSEWSSAFGRPVLDLERIPSSMATRDVLTSNEESISSFLEQSARLRYDPVDAAPYHISATQGGIVSGIPRIVFRTSLRNASQGQLEEGSLTAELGKYPRFDLQQPLLELEREPSTFVISLTGLVSYPVVETSDALVTILRYAPTFQEQSREGLHSSDDLKDQIKTPAEILAHPPQPMAVSRLRPTPLNLTEALPNQGDNSTTSKGSMVFYEHCESLCNWSRMLGIRCSCRRSTPKYHERTSSIMAFPWYRIQQLIGLYISSSVNVPNTPFTSTGGSPDRIQVIKHRYRGSTRVLAAQSYPLQTQPSAKTQRQTRSSLAGLWFPIARGSPYVSAVISRLSEMEEALDVATDVVSLNTTSERDAPIGVPYVRFNRRIAYVDTNGKPLKACSSELHPISTKDQWLCTGLLRQHLIHLSDGSRHFVFSNSPIRLVAYGQSAKKSSGHQGYTLNTDTLFVLTRRMARYLVGKSAGGLDHNPYHEISYPDPTQDLVLRVASVPSQDMMSYLLKSSETNGETMTYSAEVKRAVLDTLPPRCRPSRPNSSCDWAPTSIAEQTLIRFADVMPVGAEVDFRTVGGHNDGENEHNKNMSNDATRHSSDSNQEHNHFSLSSAKAPERRGKVFSRPDNASGSQQVPHHDKGLKKAPNANGTDIYDRQEDQDDRGDVEKNASYLHSARNQVFSKPLAVKPKPYPKSQESRNDSSQSLLYLASSDIEDHDPSEKPRKRKLKRRDRKHVSYDPVFDGRSGYVTETLFRWHATWFRHVKSHPQAGDSSTNDTPPDLIVLAMPHHLESIATTGSCLPCTHSKQDRGDRPDATSEDIRQIPLDAGMQEATYPVPVTTGSGNEPCACRRLKRPSRLVFDSPALLYPHLRGPLLPLTGYEWRLSDVAPSLAFRAPGGGIRLTLRTTDGVDKKRVQRKIRNHNSQAVSRLIALWHELLLDSVLPGQPRREGPLPEALKLFGNVTSAKISLAHKVKKVFDLSISDSIAFGFSMQTADMISQAALGMCLPKQDKTNVLDSYGQGLARIARLALIAEELTDQLNDVLEEKDFLPHEERFLQHVLRDALRVRSRITDSLGLNLCTLMLTTLNGEVNVPMSFEKIHSLIEAHMRQFSAYSKERNEGAFFTVEKCQILISRYGTCNRGEMKQLPRDQLEAMLMEQRHQTHHTIKAILDIRDNSLVLDPISANRIKDLTNAGFTLYKRIASVPLENAPVIAYDPTWGRLVAVQFMEHDGAQNNSTTLCYSEQSQRQGSDLGDPDVLWLQSLDLSAHSPEQQGDPTRGFEKTLVPSCHTAGPRPAGIGWGGISFALATWARLEPGHVDIDVSLLKLESSRPVAPMISDQTVYLRSLWCRFALALLRNMANPAVSGDNEYPTLRAWDAYSAHAARPSLVRENGTELIVQRALPVGASLLMWYSVYLLALLFGDVDMLVTAQALEAGQLRAARTYWQALIQSHETHLGSYNEMPKVFTRQLLSPSLEEHAIFATRGSVMPMYPIVMYIPTDISHRAVECFRRGVAQATALLAVVSDRELRTATIRWSIDPERSFYVSSENRVPARGTLFTDQRAVLNLISPVISLTELLLPPQWIAAAWKAKKQVEISPLHEQGFNMFTGRSKESSTGSLAMSTSISTLRSVVNPELDSKALASVNATYTPWIEDDSASITSAMHWIMSRPKHLNRCYQIEIGKGANQFG